MTGADWLGRNDPGPMLNFLRGKASERKLRLFAYACCRPIRHLLVDERSRAAVEMVERLADQAAGEIERRNARHAAHVARSQVPRPVRWAARAAYGITHGNAWDAAYDAWHYAVDPGNLDTARHVAAQAALLREIVGNPFRPVTIHPTWVWWNDGTIAKLAEAIYEERASDRLPILGDALEEAGCTSEELLSHCRAGGEYVRGCWAVDLLLGKE
jgi:hypothetical protein